MAESDQLIASQWEGTWDDEGDAGSSTVAAVPSPIRGGRFVGTDDKTFKKLSDLAQLRFCWTYDTG